MGEHGPIGKEIHELGVSAFERAEMSIGLNYAPEGLLVDIELRDHFKPADSIRYDPMHCLIANGIANIEIYLFLCYLFATHGKCFMAISLFVTANWKASGMSKRNASLLRQFFTEKRKKACDRKAGLKATASEILAMLPLLRRFAELFAMPGGLIDAACASFFALCDLIDGMQDAKRQRQVISAAELAKRLHAYLEATKAAWGLDHFTPKHHWSLHLAIQYLLDLFLMDCFALERKHRLMSRYSNQTNNLAGFSLSVLTRAVHEQLRMMQALLPGFDIPSTSRSPALESLFGPDVRIGTRVTSVSHTYETDDIVFVHGECFLIRACFGGAECGLVLQSFSRTRKVSEATSEFSLRPSYLAATFSSMGIVQFPHYWSYNGDSVLILHPAHVA